MRYAMSFTAVGLAIMLGGCMGTQIPRIGRNNQSQVPVHVTWHGEMRSGTFQAHLDNKVVTDQFRIDYVTNRAVAQLTPTSGTHQLRVSGDLWSTLLQNYHRHSTTRTFTVSPASGSFGFSLQPTTLLLERGGSGQVAVNVERAGSFNGAIEFSSTAPSGVSTNAPTIASGQSTGTLTVTVGADAAFTTRTLDITGRANIDSLAKVHEQSLTLKVARKSGMFVAADPAFQLVGQNLGSPDDRFNVTISTGQQVADPADYAATFRQGAQTLGAPIGFFLDPDTKQGGAGFCPTSDVGVVLSGQGARLGMPSQYRITFIDLAQVPHALRSFPVDGSKGNYTFAPRVYFSPDCTLALIAGANSAGASNNVLSIFDLRTGDQIGHNIEFNSGSFSASITNTGNQSVLNVTADQQSYQLPL